MACLYTHCINPGPFQTSMLLRYNNLILYWWFTAAYQQLSSFSPEYHSIVKHTESAFVLKPHTISVISCFLTISPISFCLPINVSLLQIHFSEYSFLLFFPCNCVCISRLHCLSPEPILYFHWSVCLFVFHQYHSKFISAALYWVLSHYFPCW